MVDVTLRLEGVTPLLCDSLDPRLIAIGPQGKWQPTVPDGMTPKEQCERRLYTDAQGREGIPGDMLWAAICNGGRHIQLQKSQMITSKNGGTTLGTFLELLDGFFPFDGDSYWMMDYRKVANPAGKHLSRVRYWRPKYPKAKWTFEVRLRYDETVIDEDRLRQLFLMAGFRCGLGTFRPNENGTGHFGKFRVTEWQATKVEKAA